MILGWTRLYCLGGLVLACSHAATFSNCDINQDGVTNVADVQKEINEALGVATSANDLNGDGAVNVADVQIPACGVLKMQDKKLPKATCLIVQAKIEPDGTIVYGVIERHAHRIIRSSDLVEIVPLKNLEVEMK